MGDYFDELCKTMSWLGEQPKVRFIGQSVVWDGHSLFKSMTGVSMEKRLELPVFEDFQMGMSIGIALEGWTVVNIYPRWDFLIIAANQMVNHLANVQKVSRGGYRPRVITRVSVGATKPLYSGLQHSKNHTEAARLLLKDDVVIFDLKDKRDIQPAYEYAVQNEESKPCILVEYTDLYHEQKD